MVDLPIPGEPPSNTSDPGTRPPPRTRSSSPMPVEKRGMRGAWTLRSVTGRSGAPGLWAPGPRLPGASGWGRRASSTIVLHSPHPGHRPCHLAESCAHEEQTKTVAERGIWSI
ncbi:MAG: hypothetical protein WKF40_01435 [Thermoleophilaceae bacterium]